MTAHGVYGMSAITALTAQNTIGVTGIMEVSPEFLELQLDAIFSDIYPDAIKIGMVSSSKLIESISNKLEEYKAKNIVVDPVMVSTSGSKLLKDEAIDTLKKYLFNKALIITPNIPEGEILAEMKIKNEDDMIKAAKIISQEYSCGVLLKGGHSINDANDLYCFGEEIEWFIGERIDNENTHGTGCTLSSAIASNLALGFDLKEAIKRGKEYISGSLKSGLDIGKGSGPLNHMWNINTGENK